MLTTLNTSVAPILKWAGGKRWLSDRLAPAFESFNGVYHEPFLGSAAVFFRHHPVRALLSDANHELIECYTSIRDYPYDVYDELKMLAASDPDEIYYEVRSAVPKTPVARAARFIFLNRTCYNGLYRVNMRGQFNVPRGTKRQVILPNDDFVAVSKVLAGAQIKACDFEQTINCAQSGDMIFADPPYTVSHNGNGFIKYNQKIFSWDDQCRLAQALKTASHRGVAVIATNADHPDVKELYKDFDIKVSLSRSSVIAASSLNRKETTELLVANFEWGGSLPAC